jgi:hypothetical protein
MPTADKTEHDFIENPKLGSGVTLKEFMVAVLNERERRYEEKFATINHAIGEMKAAVAGYARKDEVAIAMTASEKAIVKAEIAVEKRFDSVNEFRAQMADQQATLVRKDEVDIRFTALDEKLNTAVAQLQLRTGREEGTNAERTGRYAMTANVGIIIGIIVGAAGIIIAVVTIMRH